MQINVRLFASYRELIGRSTLEVDVPDGTSVEELYGALQRQYPPLAELRRFTTFAVNRDVVSGETVLDPDDEVAFLQPVSGG